MSSFLVQLWIYDLGINQFRAEGNKSETDRFHFKLVYSFSEAILRQKAYTSVARWLEVNIYDMNNRWNLFIAVKYFRIPATFMISVI